MEKYSFTIPGEPVGKARAKTVRNKYTGKTMSYTPEKTANYENLVKVCYKGKYFGDNAITVGIDAYFKIPASYSKKKKAQCLYNGCHATKKPDCDNIAKIICDALNGIAYDDDKQIVELVVRKLWAEVPYVEVEICSI